MQGSRRESKLCITELVMHYEEAMSKNIIKQYKNGSSRSSNKDSSENKIIIYVIFIKEEFFL